LTELSSAGAKTPSQVSQSTRFTTSGPKAKSAVLAEKWLSPTAAATALDAEKAICDWNGATKY
jgi:hypothetical protein